MFQNSCPGLSQDELVAFKEEYGPSAFVCGIRGCDRSVVGYASANRLEDHEARHQDALKCSELSCTYNQIGFSSSKQLREHKRKRHLVSTAVEIPQQVQRATRQQAANNQAWPSNHPSARPYQEFRTDFNSFSEQDKFKIGDLANKMMLNASKKQNENTRLQLQERLSPQHLAELQAGGLDPLWWFYLNQAYQILKSNNSLQIPNAPQAATMQRQHAQQSLQPQIAAATATANATGIGNYE
ncbi:hypothetical protein G7Z17_g5206 [Cylindrodendrum hubeiense]|uniref:C2H2-type domain-containing protein n=1 Tax=Cylindrodendrum hubeiense TaxID=595255 RepID=A0A9P5H9C5_9HYPO|nr:hypothetical protein G7Z17_g5206 [Cylindrodendrum hubeiense]